MQVDLLAERGLVYVTNLRLDNGWCGAVIAANRIQAEQLCAARGQNEKIIGVMGRGFLQSLKKLSSRRRMTNGMKSHDAE